MVAVPPDWADPSRQASATVVCASHRAPEPLVPPDVMPLRSRDLAADGVRYAVAPFGCAGLVLLAARDQHSEPQAAAFHHTEVDRAAQLVRAVVAVLGDRLVTSPAAA